MLTRLLLPILFFAPTLLFSQWQVDSLSEARTELKGISVDDKVYFIAGRFTGTTSSAIIDIYDSTTETWSVIPTPEEIYGSLHLELNGKFYIRGKFGVVHVYDIQNDLWTELDPPTSSNYNFAGMGNLFMSSDFNDLDIYDTEAETWTSYEFTNRQNNTMVAADGRVFVAGGYGNDGRTNLVEILDVQTGIWTSDSISIPRGNMKSIAYQNKAYFIGGDISGTTRVPRMDILDLTSNTWTIDSISRARWDFDVTAYNGKIYVAGGQVFSFSDQFRSEVDIYDPSSGTWELINLPTGRSKIAAVGHNNKMYFAGGRSDEVTSRLNLIDIYELGPTNSIADVDPINFSIQPNPVSDYLDISSEDLFDQIIIYNQVGQQVLILDVALTYTTQVNTSSMPSGVYYIQTSTSNAMTKFIKQ